MIKNSNQNKEKQHSKVVKILKDAGSIAWFGVKIAAAAFLGIGGDSNKVVKVRFVDGQVTLLSSRHDVVGTIDNVNAVIGWGDGGIAVAMNDGRYGFFTLKGVLEGRFYNAKEFDEMQEMMANHFGNGNISTSSDDDPKLYQVI